MRKLINCKKCGILFPQKLRNICDNCLDKENNEINQINKVVNACKENFISLEQISKKTGINLKEIEELYNSGRFINILEKIATKCKICGCVLTPINKKVIFAQNALIK